MLLYQIMLKAGSLVLFFWAALNMQVGDRVFFLQHGIGTFAEKAALDESNAGLLKGLLSYEQGAAVSVPYMTALWAIKYRCDCLLYLIYLFLHRDLLIPVYTLIY